MEMFPLVNNQYEDNAAGVFRSIGKNIELCGAGGAFAKAMPRVYSCTSRNTNAGGISTRVAELEIPLSCCSSLGVYTMDGLYSSYRSSECASYASKGSLGPVSLGCVLTQGRSINLSIR